MPKSAASNDEKRREELEELKAVMALQLKKVAQGSSEATMKKIQALEKRLDNNGTEEEGAALAVCEL